MKSKILSIVLCIAFMFPASLFAEEEKDPTAGMDVKITVLQAGEKAPFTGLLLTYDAMNKIKFDTMLSLQLVENKLAFERQMKQHEMSLFQEAWEAERELNLYRMDVREDYIAKLESQTINDSDQTMLYVVGAFLAGSLMTVGMAYSLGGAR